jgi:hypothetical protein
MSLEETVTLDLIAAARGGYQVGERRVCGHRVPIDGENSQEIRAKNVRR